MRKLNRGLFLALICSMALAGCGNSADSAAETENENTASENTVVSENENIPLNFNLKITDARTDGDELSIMYLVSLPSNDEPASDMEFEKIELMTADGNTADCEFDGVELYSDNGQDSVYTIDYKFNGEVPAGNYELKFDPGSLTERFVRGDVSRSTEGSGLGLAIAETFVTLMKGQIEVSADGDLFKIEIRFAELPQESAEM